jgi:hypothetical protein
LYHIFSGIAVTEGVDFGADVAVRESGLGRVIVLSLAMCQVCEGKKKMRRTRATMGTMLADFNAEHRFEKH